MHWEEDSRGEDRSELEAASSGVDSACSVRYAYDDYDIPSLGNSTIGNLSLTSFDVVFLHYLHLMVNEACMSRSGPP